MPATLKEKKSPRSRNNYVQGSGFIWFPGFIGALIYYLQQADNFGDGVLAFLKALAWPAFLVYKLLG